MGEIPNSTHTTINNITMSTKVTPANAKVDHIINLKGTSNFIAWRDNMQNILKDCGVYRHIEGSENRTARYPVSPKPNKPAVDVSDNIIAVYCKWWSDDNSIKILITWKVSALVKSNLNIGQDITARIVWNQILTRYACVNINAKFAIKKKLASMKLKDYTKIEKYLGEFRMGKEQLKDMGVNYPKSDIIHHIIHGLPSMGAWPNFKQLMIQLYQDTLDRNKTARDEGRTLFAPNTALERITSCLTIECQCLEAESTSKRHPPGSKYSNFLNDNRPIAKYANNPNGVRCTNCKNWSHDKDHCWAKGGGMEGQGPAYHVAVAAKRTEMASVAMESTSLDSSEISCVLIEEINDSAPNTPLTTTTSLLLTSILLDLGATLHIIKSRALFHTYSEADTQNVTTANLRTLRTQGGGTCIINVMYSIKENQSI
ncbi:hypothetical protein JR316_0001262 [Psilocybe cubensis]|uniref:Uncharacterized protein n=2 Tax=Psilocybe cubensis TaxID=181762 RepID=A0ACB8HH16_PSICU|nr:hypothetical protein JR316_0001262 [Psilocybe cubensis]KAH9487193.1 hypothetical protein JR316_0001262 [Psilocybe cubensis]